MIIFFYCLDAIIFLTLCAGLFYASVKNFSLQISNRGLALLGMYFFFSLVIAFDIMFDRSLHITEAYLSFNTFSIVTWYGKKIATVFFTVLAIPFSNNFKFWGK